MALPSLQGRANIVPTPPLLSSRGRFEEKGGDKDARPTSAPAESAVDVRQELTSLRSLLLKAREDIDSTRVAQERLAEACTGFSSELSRLGAATASSASSSARPPRGGSAPDAAPADDETVRRVATALHGFVRSEVVTMSKSMVAAFKMEMDGRMNEFQGCVSAVDRDQTSLRRGFEDWQRVVGNKFAHVIARLDKVGPSMQSELQKTLGVVDSKLELIENQTEAARRDIRRLVHEEIDKLAQKSQANTLELHRLIRSQEHYFREARAEKDQVEARCIKLVADAEASFGREVQRLEGDTGRLSADCLSRDEACERALAEAREEARQRTDGLGAALEVRISDIVEEETASRKQLQKGIARAQEGADKAAAAAERAMLRVDDRFEEMVSVGSQSLKMQIETAVERSANQSDLPEADYEGAFYGLIARQILDKELQAMMDRAISKMQQVSDDVAGRVGAFQDLAATADRSLSRAMALSAAGRASGSVSSRARRESRE